MFVQNRLKPQYARVMFPVKDEERPIRYLFIAVHRIVAVQSLVGRFPMFIGTTGFGNEMPQQLSTLYQEKSQ